MDFSDRVGLKIIISALEMQFSFEEPEYADLDHRFLLVFFSHKIWKIEPMRNFFLVMGSHLLIGGELEKCRKMANFLI